MKFAQQTLTPFRPMTHLLQGIAPPHFILGPDGTWVVPGEHWVPASIWDLVSIRQPVFIPHETDDPRASTLKECGLIADSPMLPSCPSAFPVQLTAYIDPCYFAPTFRGPNANSVAVLPTVEEEGQFVSSLVAGRQEVLNVGVQTSEDADSVEWRAGFEDAGVQTSDYEEEAGV